MQLGDISRDPPRLIAVERFGRCARIIEIDRGELLPVVVAHDKARVLLLDDYGGENGRVIRQVSYFPAL